MKDLFCEIIEGAVIVVFTIAIYFVLAMLLMGFSCAMHGDLGPYPEEEYRVLLVIPAFLGACYLLRGRK